MGLLGLGCGGPMTKEEAENLKVFENTCMCGGFAWNLNGRPQEQPHMAWCPQYDEYQELYQALNGAPRGAR